MRIGDASNARPARNAAGTQCETPPVYVERLKAAGARVAAEFRGFEPPLEGVVYDPIDANYVPLAGFGPIIRPGPNLTIWEVSANAR